MPKHKFSLNIVKLSEFQRKHDGALSFYEFHKKGEKVYSGAKPRKNAIELIKPKNQTHKWLLKGTLPDKPQHKALFNTKEDAITEQQHLAERYNYRASLSPDEKDQAITALQTLKTQEINKSAKGKNIIDAVNWFLNNYRGTFEKTSYYIDQFLLNKKSRAENGKTWKNSNQYLKGFKKAFGHVVANKLNHRDIQTYLDSFNNDYQHRLRYTKEFLNHLSGNHKKIIIDKPVFTSHESPLNKLEPYPNDIRFNNNAKSNQAEIKNERIIASIDEVEDLFYYSIQDSFIFYTAFCFFTGTRPEEAGKFWSTHKLGWNNIDLERKVITMPPFITKTRRSKIMPIEPVLLEWLNLFNEFPQIYTIYKTPSRQFNQIKENVWKKFPKKEYTRGKFNRRDARIWGRKNDYQSKFYVANIIRHTMISFYCKIKEINDVATICGNSADIIASHYLTYIKDQKDVDRFWNLSPEYFEEKHNFKFPNLPPPPSKLL